MRPRSVGFTIRGLVIAVLVVAVLLSMPIRDLIFLILCTTVLAIMFCCKHNGKSDPDVKVYESVGSTATRSLNAVVRVNPAVRIASLGLPDLTFCTVVSGGHAIINAVWCGTEATNY
jgi:hypothetical protein